MIDVDRRVYLIDEPDRLRREDLGLGLLIKLVGIIEAPLFAIDQLLVVSRRHDMVTIDQVS